MALLAAACPEPSERPAPEPDGTPSPSASASAVPGVVRFGILGEPATLDPYDPQASDLTWALARPLYPSLYRFLPDGSTEPLLAASIDPVPSGVRIRLADARWSNGSRIAAQDVVASWRRARSAEGSPSGLAAVRKARAVDARTVELRADIDDWEVALATVAYVLPGGRHGGATAGPFRITDRVPGLGVVMEPDPGWFAGPAGVTTVKVRFIQTTGTMLALLADDRLDAAAVPSTVNLTARATAEGLEARSALGWESIRLRFGPDLDRDERLGFLAALDQERIEEVLVRGDGRRSTTLHPGPDGAHGPYRGLGSGREPAGEITVASPGGDELGTLLLRAVYAQLDDAGIVAEASPIDPLVFYGQWATEDPADVSIRRASGAPGLRVPADDAGGLSHAPLFHVATFIVTRDGLEGPSPNPTLDGPLWNAHEWSAP